MKIKLRKKDLQDPDLEMPELTDQQLRSMRRGSPERTEYFRKALENTFHRPFPPRIGRPPKKPEEKYRPVYMKLHPRALAWVQAQAKKRGVGYQTVINEVLLSHAA